VLLWPWRDILREKEPVGEGVLASLSAFASHPAPRTATPRSSRPAVSVSPLFPLGLPLRLPLGIDLASPILFAPSRF